MPTTADLIQLVRDSLDESIPAQFSDPMLIRWLNEGNRDLARSTRHLKDKITVNTVAGSGSYALPANIVAVEHCYFSEAASGRNYPMTPRHLENFDAVRGYDWSREGTPSFFTTQGFAPSLTLTTFPVPVSSADHFTLLVARLPVAIDPSASDLATVDTVEAWFDALVDYCEFKALRRDRDPRWQESYQFYQEKRDGLINNPDYHTANREMVADPSAGYLPRWLVEFD